MGLKITADPYDCHPFVPCPTRDCTVDTHYYPFCCGRHHAIIWHSRSCLAMLPRVPSSPIRRQNAAQCHGKIPAMEKSPCNGTQLIPEYESQMASLTMRLGVSSSVRRETCHSQRPLATGRVPFRFPRGLGARQQTRYLYNHAHLHGEHAGSGGQ